MSEKKDSVFQVSLTEIAFTLVLLMVLLLGLRYYMQQQEIVQQKEKISEQAVAIEALRKQINSQFGGICEITPEDPIEPMMPCIKCVSAAGKMTREEAANSVNLGKDLFEQWKARKKENQSFDDFKQELEKAAAKLAAGEHLVVDSEKQKVLDDALNAKRNLEIALKTCQADALNVKSDLETELKTCQATSEFFKRRAGMDKPPCWLQPGSARVQYLFDVTILADSSYEVKPAWPANREAEALAIPGVREMVRNKRMNREEFNRYSGQVLSFAEQQKPEACRHYVLMRNQVPDRPTADRARLNLEQFFYKYEFAR